MTFSERCKREITKVEYEKSCCTMSHLFGLLCFSKDFSKYRTAFTSEHAFLIKHYVRTLKQCGFNTSKVQLIENQKTTTLSISDREENDRLLFDFGYVGDEANLRLNADNLMCGECFAAFLGGAFLAGGTVTDPKINYHLEFSTHKSAFAGDFCELLKANGFTPRISERGYSKIIYFKDSSQIEDALAIAGATNCSMDLMNTKIFKDIRNQTNRRTNCESANIDKTVAAVAEVLNDINYLKQTGCYSALNDGLKEIAKLRIDNPELSLCELGEAMNPKLAKSSVNYRLNKIRAFAKAQREKDGHLQR